jgi:hypothetical protein
MVITGGGCHQMVNRKVVNAVIEDIRLKVTLAGMVLCGLAALGIIIIAVVVFT